MSRRMLTNAPLLLGPVVTLLALSACVDATAPASPDPGARSVRVTAATESRDHAAAAVEDAANRLTSALDPDESAPSTRALRSALESLSAAIDRPNGPLTPFIEAVERALSSSEAGASSAGERAELDAVRLALRSAARLEP